MKRARFTKYTRVIPVQQEPPEFSMYCYNIAPFEILKGRKGCNKNLSNAIGVLQSCSLIDIKNTKHGARALRNVSITNGRENASVSLWGELAHKFHAEQYMKMAQEHPVVLLFCGVTSDWYNGELSLQAAATCRWYVNPEIPETMDIKNSTIWTAK